MARADLEQIETKETTSPVTTPWTATVGGYFFYTDDASLFSATRRSGLDGDPSQPVLDASRTGHGSDMVFEPNLLVSKLISSPLGNSTLSVKAQGFIYAVNNEFNHASVQLEALHVFAPDTAIRLRYYVAPDRLVGVGEERRSGNFLIQDERVTSHIGSVRIEQRLSENWEARIQGRVGVRQYNAAFAQRDTTFWTIGPHLAWRMTDHLRFLLGYHYERGLSDGRKQAQFEDDPSYVHHFAALSMEAELTEHLELELGMHYERNNWTSSIVGDERNGEHENIFQGEVRLLYRLTEQSALILGFQRSNRRESFEQKSDHNTNVSIGGTYRF